VGLKIESYRCKAISLGKWEDKAIRMRSPLREKVLCSYKLFYLICSITWPIWLVGSKSLFAADLRFFRKYLNMWNIG
jgi:hypothetical protein